MGGYERDAYTGIRISGSTFFFLDGEERFLTENLRNVVTTTFKRVPCFAIYSFGIPRRCLWSSPAEEL